MILLTLSRGKGEETVRLQLPASPAEIGETFAFLDRISLDTHVCLNRQANGLSCGSVILLEQLRTIDKSRLRERVGALDTSEMKQIDWALGVSVGLAEGYR